MYKILNKRLKKRDKEFFDNVNSDFFDLSISQTELDIFLDTPVMKKGLSIPVLVDLEMFLTFGLSKLIINDFVCRSILKLPYRPYQPSEQGNEDDDEDDNEDEEEDEYDEYKKYKDFYNFKFN